MQIDIGLAIPRGKKPKRSLDRKFSKSLLALTMSGVLLAGVLLVPSAFAGFDHMFFSINGDTTLSTMTQGDAFSWGSNCDTGATINWEIWYDVNSNAVIDPATDYLLTSDNITDGNAVTEPNPILDGYAMTEIFFLSGEPGLYVFKATDLATDSSLRKIMTMVAMSSPPNQFTGQINLPGVSAPNNLLANRAVSAESDTGDEGAFFAMTNNMGMYSINVGAAGTGVDFYFDASNVSGFVTPDYISATAGGVVGGNDFTYMAATDSVWGFVKDELGNVLTFKTSIAARSNNTGRQTTTLDGRYAIFFSGSDSGEWTLDMDSRISPLFLSPDGFSFDLDAVSNFQKDIILTRTDALIYARITENGGLPANNYRVDAYSSLLGSWTESVSGTGTDNLVSLHVSSLDPSDWSVFISTWDDNYPIPAPLIASGEAYNVAPGDTVALALVDGYLVSGTLTQDAGDAPIIWDVVYVAAGIYGTNAGFGGAFSFYADTGDYYMGAFADGYLSNPETRFVDLTSDTSSGINFIINEANCRVTGTLINVALPLDNPYHTVVARTGSDNFNGYWVTAQVDSSTGTYQMDLCDGDWTIVPPCCFPDVDIPDSLVVTIGEAPDTVRIIDFEYTVIGGSCCISSTVGDVNQSGGVDITDVQVMVDHQFLSLQPLVCFDEGDIDFSGGIDITDLQTMLDYQYRESGSGDSLITEFIVAASQSPLNGNLPAIIS